MTLSGTGLKERVRFGSGGVNGNQIKNLPNQQQQSASTVHPMRRSLFALSGIVFSIVLFYGQPAFAQDADAVAKRVQEKYDSIHSMRAHFRQTMKSDMLESSESNEGRLVLNGKQFRVEMPNQTFVTDGSSTWLYNAETNEVLINDYVEEDMFPVRDMIFNYSDRYTVDGVTHDVIGGVSTDILALSAIDETDLYRHLTLFVRRTDAIVTRVEILDANETTMIFDLSDIEVNPSLDAAEFSFQAPAGTEVVDLRS